MEPVTDQNEDKWCCIDFRAKLKEGKVFTILELRILLDYAQKNSLPEFENLINKQL